MKLKNGSNNLVKTRKRRHQVYKRIHIKDSEVYAKNTLFKIKKKVDLLIQNPNLGRNIPEVSNPIYREIIEGNYRIMFKKVGFEIQILTIFHGARAFQKDMIV